MARGLMEGEGHPALSVLTSWCSSTLRGPCFLVLALAVPLPGFPGPSLSQQSLPHLPIRRPWPTQGTLSPRLLLSLSVPALTCPWVDGFGLSGLGLKPHGRVTSSLSPPAQAPAMPVDLIWKTPDQRAAGDAARGWGPQAGLLPMASWAAGQHLGGHGASEGQSHSLCTGILRAPCEEGRGNTKEPAPKNNSNAQTATSRGPGLGVQPTWPPRLSKQPCQGEAEPHNRGRGHLLALTKTGGCLPRWKVVVLPLTRPCRPLDRAGPPRGSQGS